eukprot:1090130-Rhodomonas_salina.2
MSRRVSALRCAAVNRVSSGCMTCVSRFAAVSTRPSRTICDTSLVLKAGLLVPGVARPTKSIPAATTSTITSLKCFSKTVGGMSCLVAGELSSKTAFERSAHSGCFCSHDRIRMRGALRKTGGKLVENKNWQGRVPRGSARETRSDGGRCEDGGEQEQGGVPRGSVSTAWTKGGVRAAVNQSDWCFSTGSTTGRTCNWVREHRLLRPAANPEPTSSSSGLFFSSLLSFSLSAGWCQWGTAAADRYLLSPSSSLRSLEHRFSQRVRSLGCGAEPLAPNTTEGLC